MFKLIACRDSKSRPIIIVIIINQAKKSEISINSQRQPTYANQSISNGCCLVTPVRFPLLPPRAKWCMIKIFRGGGWQGWWQLQKPPPPTNNFRFYPPTVSRCFRKDPLMTPHHPTSSIFHCYPLPIQHPFPPHKNFDHAHVGTMSDINADSGDLQVEKVTKSSEKEKDHAF